MQIEDEDKKPMKNKRQMKRKNIIRFGVGTFTCPLVSTPLVLNVLNNSGYDLKVMSYDAAGGLQQYLIKKGSRRPLKWHSPTKLVVEFEVAFGSTRASRN